MVTLISMMTYTIRNSVLVAFCAALLAGCVGSGDKYPSLAVRDAERQMTQDNATDTSAELAAIPAATPEDVARMRGYVEQARAAHQNFVAGQPGAAQSVRAARGSGVEDERRSRALVAVAGLTTLHGKTTLALSYLDEMEFSAATAFDAIDEIKEAQAVVNSLIREQDAALDSLTAQLATR